MYHVYSVEIPQGMNTGIQDNHIKYNNLTPPTFRPKYFQFQLIQKLCLWMEMGRVNKQHQYACNSKIKIYFVLCPTILTWCCRVQYANFLTD